jgi:hypothetical protein
MNEVDEVYNEYINLWKDGEKDEESYFAFTSGYNAAKIKYNQKPNTMKNKFKIIETKDYILAVSDEQPVKDYYYDTNINNIRHTGGAEYAIDSGVIQVIAYQPKGNAPELDLPLLPEMVVEDDVDLKLQHRNFSKQVKNPYLTEEKEYQIWERAYIEGFEECYKAATKTYTEKDLIILFRAGYDWGAGKERFGKSWTIEEKVSKIIQSLKQPKTSKWFVAEIVPNFSKMPINGKDFPRVDVLKTTTINGKIYLVGKFLNK